LRWAPSPRRSRRRRSDEPLTPPPPAAASCRDASSSSTRCAPAPDRPPAQGHVQSRDRRALPPRTSTGADRVPPRSCASTCGLHVRALSAGDDDTRGSQRSGAADAGATCHPCPLQRAADGPAPPASGHDRRRRARGHVERAPRGTRSPAAHSPHVGVTEARVVRGEDQTPMLRQTTVLCEFQVASRMIYLPLRMTRGCVREGQTGDPFEGARPSDGRPIDLCSSPPCLPRPPPRPCPWLRRPGRRRPLRGHCAPAELRRYCLVAASITDLSGPRVEGSRSSSLRSCFPGSFVSGLVLWRGISNPSLRPGARVGFRRRRLQSRPFKAVARRPLGLARERPRATLPHRLWPRSASCFAALPWPPLTDSELLDAENHELVHFILVLTPPLLNAVSTSTAINGVPADHPHPRIARGCRRPSCRRLLRRVRFCRRPRCRRAVFAGSTADDLPQFLRALAWMRLLFHLCSFLRAPGVDPRTGRSSRGAVELFGKYNASRREIAE
jgi:hypothetical protein